MRFILLSILAIMASIGYAQVPSSTQMGYTYTLPTDMTNVTVGIKDSTGALIRTLTPRGQPQNAGSYSGVWDGNTDTGSPASGGPFTIAVLYGSPTYTFDGVLGDTSNNWTGYSQWAASQEYLAISRMTFINGTGWITEGYSEGTSALNYFSDSNPNSPNVVSPSYIKQQGIDFTDIDNDGQYLYLESAAEFAGPGSFVTKFDGFTGRPVLFTQGQTSVGATPLQGGGSNFAFPATTMTAIDINTSVFVQPPTAIAVQTGSNLLAVAHGNWRTIDIHDQGAINFNNVIEFFDKTTGASTGTNVTLPNPTSMAFDSNGNLWVVGNGLVNLITSPSVSNTVTNPISGLVSPVALTVNKATNHIYVLDGGSSQQLKEFDSSFNLVRTYGVLGGYTDCNPTVASNRLMLDQTAITGSSTLPTPVLSAVRVESNGDVWINESMTGVRKSGPGRIQHLTPNGATFTLVHQIQHTGLEYYMGISHTQPSRVFMGLQEYSFNYNVPNLPGDPAAPGGSGSWQLVRDWAVGSQGACGSVSPFPTIINGSELLSNGHVYADIAVSGSAVKYIDELPASGTSPLRKATNLTLVGGRAWIMARDGSFYSLANTGSGASSVVTISNQPITGFDGSNNPIYSVSATTEASITFNSATQPTLAQFSSFGPENNFEPTTGGTYAGMQFASHNNSSTTNFPHVGGLKAGRSSYLFTTAPEVCSYFLGIGTYPCATLSNPGPNILTEGRHVVVPFTTNSSQLQPAFWDYWEDGMFLGQFGPYWGNSAVPTGPNTIPAASVPGFFNSYNNAVGFQGAQPSQTLGFVENVGSTRLVTVNGNLYLFLDAEGGATPISIWQMGNQSSIHEFSGTGSLGQTVALTTSVF